MNFSDSSSSILNLSHKPTVHCCGVSSMGSGLRFEFRQQDLAKTSVLLLMRALELSKSCRWVSTTLGLLQSTCFPLIESQEGNKMVTFLSLHVLTSLLLKVFIAEMANGDSLLFTSSLFFPHLPCNSGSACFHTVRKLVADFPSIRLPQSLLTAKLSFFVRGTSLFLSLDQNLFE